MKKIIIAIALITLTLLNSCEDPSVPYLGQADFTHFEFQYMLGEAKIDRLNKTIFAEIDAVANVDSLITIFRLTDGATAYHNNQLQKSGESYGDFSKIVEYDIVSGDGKTKNKWTIIIAPVNEDQGKLPDIIERNLILKSGIYHISKDLEIANNVYLGLDTGCILMLAPGVNIKASSNSALYAMGTAANPVIITSEEYNTNSESFWGSIILDNPQKTEFTYCNFENGGSNSAAISVNLCSPGFNNCKFENIKNSAIYINSNANFRVFQNCEMRECGENIDGAYPIHFATINSITNLGDNNNIQTSKGIFLEKTTVSNNITIVGQGHQCPFIIPEDLQCNYENLTIFISNGAKFIMAEGKGILIAQNAKVKFIAEGEENSTIIFTSTGTTRGMWKGIQFGKNLLPNSLLKYCNIDYAGNGNATGAIECAVADSTYLQISNCTISNTNSHGIFIYPNCNATINANNVFNNIGMGFENIHRE